VTHTVVDLTCCICGWTRRHEVRMGLIKVNEPDEPPKWDAAPRCIDRDACRQRAFDLIEREGKP
jgi:hypothetical protein